MDWTAASRFSVSHDRAGLHHVGSQEGMMHSLVSPIRMCTSDLGVAGPAAGRGAGCGLCGRLSRLLSSATRAADSGESLCPVMLARWHASSTSSSASSSCLLVCGPARRRLIRRIHEVPRDRACHCTWAPTACNSTTDVCDEVSDQTRWCLAFSANKAWFAPVSCLVRLCRSS